MGKTGILPKTVTDFAIKHKLRIGRDCDTGLYYLRSQDEDAQPFRGIPVYEVSHRPTAKSAIIMMKRFIKRKA